MTRTEKFTIVISSISALFGLLAAAAATTNAYVAHINLQTYVNQNLHLHRIQLCAQVIADAEGLRSASSLECARVKDCREGKGAGAVFLAVYPQLVAVSKSVAQLEMSIPEQTFDASRLKVAALNASGGGLTADSVLQGELTALRAICRAFASPR